MWGLTGPGLFGVAPALLDDDDLAAAVVPATWANVMGPLHLATIAALDEGRRREEDVPSPVALPVPADSLLWQCTHGDSPDARALAPLVPVLCLVEQARERGESVVDWFVVSHLGNVRTGAVGPAGRTHRKGDDDFLAQRFAEV
jgi:hypothetical protein